MKLITLQIIYNYVGDRREFTEEDKKIQLDQLYTVLSLEFQMIDFVKIQIEDNSVCCEFRIDTSEIHNILEKCFNFIYGSFKLNDITKNEVWFFVGVLPDRVQKKHDIIERRGM